MLEHDRIDSSETIGINKTSDWNKDFTEKKEKNEIMIEIDIRISLREKSKR